MVHHLIIVEKRSDFRWPASDLRVLTAEEFIAEKSGALHRPRKIINLCRGYSYQSIGYYVSLLAEARGDRVTPNVETIVDLQQKSVAAQRLATLGKLAGQLCKIPRSIKAVSIQTFFGRIEDEDLADLAAKSFELFRCPLLAIDLERLEGGEGWKVVNIRPLDPREVAASGDAVFLDGLAGFSRRPWRPTTASSGPRLDLAILHDPGDPMPPSKLETLQTIARIGQSMDISVELIEKRDFSRLTQFDALFIRETTAVSHHTYRFAKRAASEGMPVIDDPESILRCTNKAYLRELLGSNGVDMPKTALVTRRTLGRLEGALSYPVVLKVPDGAFGLSVKKAENWREFEDIVNLMLKQSDIILAQDYLFTPFDWRIGVLAGQPLFAAKYFMSTGHWQIIRHSSAGKPVEGTTEAVPLANVPPAVLDAGVRAARLVGNGLYGVDVKQTKEGVVVIEVNDNPNLDVGLEDAAEGEEIYRRILRHFQSLVEAKIRTVWPVAATSAPSGTVVPLGRTGKAVLLKNQ